MGYIVYVPGTAAGLDVPPILNLDGTGPLDLLASTGNEAESGLVVQLTTRYAVPQRFVPGSPGPTLVGLAPVRW